MKGLAPRLLVSALCVLAGNARTGRAEAAGSLDVFVSIPPQSYFAERVGGEHVNVYVLVQPGRDPHTFQPTPRQIVMLAKAKLFFAAGIPFETTLLEKIKSSHRRLVVVNTAKGIRKRKMDGGAGEHGGHDPGRGHADQDDPHIWLSPELIKIQAGHIADALAKADPAHAQDYRENLETFVKDLDATDSRIRRALSPLAGLTFFVFHPSFGYFADAYGLRQEAVETGGKSPTPKQLARLIKKAKEHQVRIIFVQPQFDRKGAEAVAEAIGGAVLPMDPLARDVLENLEQMAQRIQKSLRRGRQ